MDIRDAIICTEDLQTSKYFHVLGIFKSHGLHVGTNTAESLDNNYPYLVYIPGYSCVLASRAPFKRSRSSARILSYESFITLFDKNKEPTAREMTTTELNKLPTTEKKEKEPMKDKIKETATSLRGVVKPYEKYLAIAALLVALDHFILKGALRERIQELATTLGNKMVATLDNFIEKIGGSDGK